MVQELKRITHGKGLYGTPVWSPRGDLIAFTKVRKGRFYIGVMRTDGTGERFYRKLLPRGTIMVTKRKSFNILQRNKIDKTGKGFTAKLWSIDITGYNERKIKTETDASDPSCLQRYQSRLFFCKFCA